MRKVSLAILLALTLSTIAVGASDLHEKASTPQPVLVKAQSVSLPTLVSIDPANVTNISIKPGTHLNYTVNIANSPPLNGFDVYVKFDPRVLTAPYISINYAGNILLSTSSSILIGSECINGEPAPGGACTNPSLDGLGVVNLGMVFRGNQSTPSITNGLLYSLTLTVNDPSLEPLDPGATQLQLAEVILSSANLAEGPVPSITRDGFFTNRYCSGTTLCTPPVAEFTFSPSQPPIGATVQFNASASFATNMNASITSYLWNWGEICHSAPTEQSTQVPTITHAFCNAQKYPVSLTVNDTYGITWTTTRSISVSYFFIDVEISGFDISPHYNVVVGTPVNITTAVANLSTISENASLTVSVNNTTLTTSDFVNIPPFSRSNPSLTTWNTTGLSAGTYTVEASLRPIPGANRTIGTRMTGNVQLISAPDRPPTAEFVFNPTSPVVEENIRFDGLASSDPDGIVQSWIWSFGDGDTVFNGPLVDHAYNQPGNYTVTLTVVDNTGLAGSRSVLLNVLPQPAHDVGIIQTYVSPNRVVSTQNAFIGVVIKNNGLNNETVSVSIFDNGHIIQTLNRVFIQACTPSSLFRICYNEIPETITWDTGAISPGNYTITTIVSLRAGEIDPTPADNNATIGTVTILPAPVIVINPDSGSLGEQVFVRGSGFPAGPQTVFPGQPQPILITFDDMFLGEAFANNGTFTFTLDVIQSQPGLHVIKAQDLSSGARASATFTVLALPSENLALTVKTGSVYFPGDTLVAYLSISLNGVPESPAGLQVSALLTYSNGTTRPMTLTNMGPGLYQAVYSIPSSGPLGTYAIVARAHLPGPVDASSMASFQVQLSWLSSNKNAVMTMAALAGVTGLVGVAWKKGYLRRNDEPAQFFD